MYKATFFNFIAYTISIISKDLNLEMLYSENCDAATLDLFLQLLEAFDTPKLSELKARIFMW